MQETLPKEVIGCMLDDCNDRTTIALTDGSCLGKPGSCGVGACHTEPSLLKHPVSSYGSILLGELIVIKLAVKHTQSKTTEADLRNTEKLHIFSDSKCAIGHLVLGWEPKSHKSTIQEVKTDITKLKESGVKVEISWTPTKGNEYVDKLAKEAADEAKERIDLPPVITMGDIKTAARESGRKNWQDVWEKSEKGRHFSTIGQKVHKIKHKLETKKGEIIISHLRTGYVKLNEYLHRK